jgi:rhamnosyltransferase
MESYATVVVLYYPDDESVANLLRMADYNGMLIIVDNSSPPADIGIVETKDIVIIRNNENMGLASALNQGINFAGLKGFENIFLLDQDTRVGNDYFDNMLRFKTKIDEKNDAYAIYVPNFFDRHSQTYAKFPVLGKYRFEHYCCGQSHMSFNKRAVIAITSGSLISYSKFKKIGPMAEEYFIDFLDNEYCLRASLGGYLVAVNCDSILDHSVGHRAQKRFLGVTFNPNNHPPVRRYYISRNGIATAIRYFPYFKSYPILLCLRLIHEYLSIILFEKNKFVKLYASATGAIDGIFNRMGPYPSKKFEILS